ncbi:hypothetical protein [Streptomyces sp. CB01881]|uniref:hypothetical protein n=1 Tax=Streptomyces sp. CB01881 TaxID=2078691 RepID=UPI000CDC74E4|nr:hypothetical protein [Streptomyces sp. CB01881]AUY51028.1 hypothetical protein C2142_21135 [Streptomyces sp. CB01881]TYC74413.1 hypothetical protein EH183_21100 [Streptomyces sp. CB01881]
MVRSLLVVPLLAAAGGGVWLARGALLRWRDLRAAETYELTGDQRPMLLRAAGAMVCGVCVTALTLLTALGTFGVLGSSAPRSGSAEFGADSDAAAADGTDGEAAARQAAPPVAEAEAASATAVSATTPAAAPVASRFDSVGHPAGGELLQSAVLGPDGHPRNVRVWLPAQYAKDPNARFPVVVMHAATPRKTADAEVPDVFEGLGSAVQTGKARPFILVAPEAPNGTAHPCELVAAAPQAIADDAALRTTIAATFRTLPPGPASWGTLGVEGGAPCAAAAALARPDLYGAAAAVSGRYDTAALALTGAEAPVGAAPKLLLAAAKADAAGLDAARKLQAALRAGTGAAARADVRISENVQDYTADRERLRLVRQAAQYLAETLAKVS